MTLYDLSKTTYLRGLQCAKSLYLDQHQAEHRDPPDPTLESRFQTGQVVHELAHALFADGVNAKPTGTFDPNEALQRTEQLIQSGATVVYEAAFLANRVLVFVDILERVGKLWNLYEVKSTTTVKEEHYPDLAIQAYVLQATGVEVNDLFIVHLNPAYIRRGDLKLQELFCLSSVKHALLGANEDIASKIAHMRAILRQRDVPAIDIGPHCSEPFDCDFCGYCWRHIPQDSVFEVARLSKKKKFDLYRRGILQMADIPTDYPMGEIARFHVDHHIRGESRIDLPAIRDFLAGLQYPLYLLDFETYNPAIPPFDGLRPYQHIPFQFSLHLQAEPGGETNHSGFLAEAGVDPRPSFVEKLLEVTQGIGSLVVYNQGFEKKILQDLIERFPALQQGLEDRIARLKDLMDPFRARSFYVPAMDGSFSLKAVLPALVSDLDYSYLAISDGQTAMHAYLDLQTETDPERIASRRRDLWEYCKLDTLAMERVLQKLYEVVA